MNHKKIYKNIIIIFLYMSLNNDDSVNNILNKNKIVDLNKFLERRAYLNNYNIKLNYAFHIIQSSGIFCTTLSSSYEIVPLLWIGIGLNFIASLITISQKINETLSQKALADIISIKNNTYIDESGIDQL